MRSKGRRFGCSFISGVNSSRVVTVLAHLPRTHLAVLFVVLDIRTKESTGAILHISYNIHSERREAMRLPVLAWYLATVYMSHEIRWRSKCLLAVTLCLTSLPITYAQSCSPGKLTTCTIAGVWLVIKMLSYVHKSPV